MSFSFSASENRLNPIEKDTKEEDEKKESQVKI